MNVERRVNILPTKNKNATRYYSDIQESRTAKNLGGQVQVSSGSGNFRKGDVFTERCLIDCKTSMKEVKSVSVKKEWLEKIREQCRGMRKQYPIIAFDFGDGDNYYIIDEKTMQKFIEFLDNE